jgi:hypothetical protein
MHESHHTRDPDMTTINESNTFWVELGKYKHIYMEGNGCTFSVAPLLDAVDTAVTIGTVSLFVLVDIVFVHALDGELDDGNDPHPDDIKPKLPTSHPLVDDELLLDIDAVEVAKPFPIVEEDLDEDEVAPKSNRNGVESSQSDPPLFLLLPNGVAADGVLDPTPNPLGDVEMGTHGCAR